MIVLNDTENLIIKNTIIDMYFYETIKTQWQ